MTEWKPVKDYEGYYEVSNQGEIRRIKAGKGARLGQCLRPKTARNGYREVVLAKDTVKTCKLVHRLVAEAFHGPSDLHVNHINSDKADNRAENLEWCTRSENMQHAIANGNHRWAQTA